MKYSCFARYGLRRYTSKPNVAQRKYEELRDNLEGAFDLTPGTFEEAAMFADAMATARSMAAVERAENASDPRFVNDMLPTLERSYGMLPSPGDNDHTRRVALAQRYKAAKGASFAAITEDLQALLGDNFVAYRPLTHAEAPAYPTDPTTTGSFPSATIPAKLFRLLGPVSIGHDGGQIRYENFDRDDGARIALNDTVVLQAENYGLCEAVKVLTADPIAKTFTASFTRSHDVGASAVVGPMPVWASMKRYALIVVKPGVVLSPDTRRKIHDVMNRVARGVSQWGICITSAPGTVGPFTVGSSAVGCVPVGTLTL